MSISLRAESNQYAELKRRVIEIDPQIDERTLTDTLEGFSNLREAIASVIRSALDDDALIKALEGRLENMKARLTRLQTRAEKKREIALAAMEEGDIERILEPDFTVSLRAVPSGVVVTNEADIPEWLWIPQPAKLDKRRLLDALKSGEAVMGAELANSKITLAIRTK